MSITSIGEIVGGILVICQAIKWTGFSKKFIPLLAIVLGVVGAFVFGGVDWANTLVGILLGLGTTLTFREIKAAVV